MRRVPALVESSNSSVEALERVGGFDGEVASQCCVVEEDRE